MSVPSPRARLAALHQLTSRLGFSPDVVVDDYRVVTESAPVRVDVAAFGRRPLDMSTALIVAMILPAGERWRGRSRAVEAAAALAAPVAVVAGDEALDIYRTSGGRRLLTVPYRAVHDADVPSDLTRNSLMAAKTRAGQLSLFPIDVHLLAQARERATTRLRHRVIEAKRAAIEHGSDLGLQLRRDDISRVIINALTALFVEDKFQVPYLSQQWSNEVGTRFSRFASDLRTLREPQRAIYETARNFLREGLDYRSLDAVVVSDLYEPRLVEPGDRNEFGVVYTPFELATRAMEHVPVELIDPEQRNVLDFACGSGTLLLAAHDRLTGSLPEPEVTHRRLGYLVSHLRGWDRDPFAVRLAHLSLTIHGEPLGNGWQIEERDTLAPSAEASDVHVIVANPPWQGRRTGGTPANSRDDIANAFVRRALELISPGGLLALLLPASWLTAQHSSDSRSHMRSVCEILEIWRLPEGAFPPSEVKGALLIAKRRPATDRSTGWYIARRIHSKKSLRDFYATGAVDRSVLVPQGIEGEPMGASSSVTRWLEGTEGLPLTAVARIRSGPPKGRSNRGVNGGGEYRWLKDLRHARHFRAITTDLTQAVRYPDDFDAKAGWPVQELYESAKVLVTRVTRSNTPWKMKVVFAFEPLIPSNNQYGLTLRNGWDAPAGVARIDALFALGGIFASSLVAAWLDDAVATGNIPRERLEALPLPRMWLKVAEPAKHLFNVTESGASDSDRRVAAIALDDAVLDLYNVPPPVRRAVRDALGDATPRDGIPRYSKRPRSGAERGVTHRGDVTNPGCVLGVEADSLRLWVDSLTPDDGVDVQPPSRLPGAALLPGATFEVASLDGDLAYASYRLHRSSYLADDHLLRPSLQ